MVIKGKKGRSRQRKQQHQSNKRTRNGAKGGTSCNPPQAVLALHAQPTPHVLPESSYNFLKIRPEWRRRRSVRIPVPSKNPRLLETVFEHPILLNLKPPSRSDHFRSGQEFLELLKWSSKVLIADINKAQDASQMVDLSSKTFAHLDSIGVNYVPLYEAVRSVVHHQCDKETLEKHKKGPAFDTKRMHDQCMSAVSSTKVKKVESLNEFEVARHKFDLNRTEVDDLKERLKKAEDEGAICRANLDEARVKKDFYEKEYCEAESNLKNIAGEMAEAQLVIDAIDNRWNEAVHRLNRSKEELSRLVSNL